MERRGFDKNSKLAKLNIEKGALRCLAEIRERKVNCGREKENVKKVGRDLENKTTN